MSFSVGFKDLLLFITTLVADGCRFSLWHKMGSSSRCSDGVLEVVKVCVPRIILLYVFVL